MRVDYANAPRVNNLILLGILLEMAGSLLTPPQIEMDLVVRQEKVVDGIEMGVLSDGTPYLTGRGLAKLCGVDQKAIVQVTQAIAEGVVRPREAKIIDLLNKQGVAANEIFLEIRVSGTAYYAFPSSSCMAFLEYYAFEAGPNLRREALDAFRLLAHRGLREFIYSNLGYDPSVIPDAWKQFHDRVTATYGDIPDGYFTVFKEAADIIVTLIRNGADVGSHFVPDGSVGIHWGRHWRDSGLAAMFGERIETNHNYPNYFPQALSNPQKIQAYPEGALPEFRRWARSVYLQEKLPPYLANKVQDGSLSIEFESKALVAFGHQPKAPALK